MSVHTCIKMYYVYKKWAKILKKNHAILTTLYILFNYKALNQNNNINNFFQNFPIISIPHKACDDKNRQIALRVKDNNSERFTEYSGKIKWHVDPDEVNIKNRSTV